MKWNISLSINFKMEMFKKRTFIKLYLSTILESHIDNKHCDCPTNRVLQVSQQSIRKTILSYISKTTIRPLEAETPETSSQVTCHIDLIQESLMFYCTITQLSRGCSRKTTLTQNTLFSICCIHWHCRTHFCFAPLPSTGLLWYISVFIRDAW